MILRAVFVEIAWDTAVDTVPILASKAGHTIVARVAAWRDLDTAHALFGYVAAHSPEERAHRVARAGTTAGKDALRDRCAIEVVATRLDANQAIGTVVVRLAGRFGRTCATQNARHAGRRPSPNACGSPGATQTANATRAAVSTITTWISGYISSAADCESRREQQNSKPSISHEGLLLNRITEILQ
jgi:hypothetical protein